MNHFHSNSIAFTFDTWKISHYIIGSSIIFVCLVQKRVFIPALSAGTNWPSSVVEGVAHLPAQGPLNLKIFQQLSQLS